MTAFVKTALLAATVSLAIAPSTVSAEFYKAASSMNITMKRGSFGLSGGTQGQSAGQNNTFCGRGDVFVIYDKDANGNRVPGTERYGCTD